MKHSTALLCLAASIATAAITVPATRVLATPGEQAQEPEFKSLPTHLTGENNRVRIVGQVPITVKPDVVSYQYAVRQPQAGEWRDVRFANADYLEPAMNKMSDQGWEFHSTTGTVFIFRKPR